MTNNVTSLKKHLLEKGKSHTWRQLAEMFHIMDDLTNTRKNNKKKSDYVRRLYETLNRQTVNVKPTVTTKNDTLMDEFKSFMKTKYSAQNITPYLNGDPNNILVIGDSHIPYNHPKYLEFCMMLQKKWNCGKIIHIGDILDFNSTTFHTPHPDGLSPYYELEISKLEIEKWHKAFPEMVVTLGNHDRRVSRKLFDGQISSHWQLSLKEVLNVNWEFVTDYEYNNIYFCHGEGASARVTALQKQMSTVQGHRHSESYIDFPAKGLFAVQTPIGVDRKQLAFEYCKTDPKEWLIGATVILNSQTPIIERLV